MHRKNKAKLEEKVLSLSCTDDWLDTYKEESKINSGHATFDVHMWHTGRGTGFVGESFLTLQHDAVVYRVHTKKPATELQKEIGKNYNVLESSQVCVGP